MRAKRLLFLALKNAALAVALLATAGLSAALTMRSMLAGQEIQVPQVVGLGLTETGEAIEGAGLSFRIEGARHDATIPAGRVLSQEPEAGQRLKVSRSVRVWLSEGPRFVSVPEVVGQPVRDARLALSDAGLPVGHVVTIEHLRAEGTVVAQHPPAGEVAAGQAQMALLVSRGPSQTRFRMPDLIGRPAERVTGSLQRAGWNLTSVRERAYPGLNQSIVLQQSPRAGYPVTPSTPIGLEISRAEP